VSAAREPVVEMFEHFYQPASLTIAAATTVAWRVMGMQTHDAVACDRSFSAPLLGPGQSFSYTFTTSGTHPYYCNPHEGDGMRGVVIVQ